MQKASAHNIVTTHTHTHTQHKNTTHHGTTTALRADMNTLHGLTMAAGNETTGSTTLFVISTKDDGRHFFYTR